MRNKKKQNMEIELEESEIFTQSSQNEDDTSLLSRVFSFQTPIWCTTPVKASIAVLVVAFILILIVSTNLVPFSSSASPSGDQLPNSSQEKPNNKWSDLRTKIEMKQDDKSQYLYQLLPNNLRVLLIINDEFQKSSASMDVKVGSFEDPSNFQGISHLLEHMLFMGNKKYQEEDTFHKVIAEAGGHTNAYTSLENTNYHFSCSHEGMIQSLDVWSGFFSSPLIKESSLEREVQAVDSEFVNTLSSEGFRIQNLQMELSDSTHPFKSFPCGNKEYLIDIPTQKGLNTQKALESYLKRHYFSQNMALVITTNTEIYNKLQIEQLFSNIPSKQNKYLTMTEEESRLSASSKTPSSESPFNTGILSVLQQNEIVQDKIIISITLDDSNKDNYQYSSLEYFSQLLSIGFQEGGLCIAAKKLYQVVDCTIDTDSTESRLYSFTELQIQFILLSNNDSPFTTIDHLTLLEIELNLIRLFYSYVQAIANYPHKESTFQTIQSTRRGVRDLGINEDDRSEMQRVSLLSKIFNQDKVKELSYLDNSILSQFNLTHFAHYLFEIQQPQNFVLIRKSKKLPDQMQSNYQELNQLNYTKQYINTNDTFNKLKHFNKTIHPLFKLTPKDYENEFDPVNDTIPITEKNTQQYPKKINSNIYALRDVNTFHKPQDLYSILLEWTDKQTSVSQVIISAMIFHIKEQLEQQLEYDIKFTGLKLNIFEAATINSANQGIVLEISCLTSQCPHSINSITNYIKLLNNESLDIVNQDKLDYLMQVTAMKLTEQSLYSPYKQLSQRLKSILVSNHFQYQELINQTSEMKVEDFKSGVFTLFNKGSLSLFAFGNIEDSQPISVFDYFKEAFKNEQNEDQSQQQSLNLLNLSKNSLIVQLEIDSSDKNNVLCANYYQLGQLNLLNQTLLSITHSFLSTHSFDFLRTKNQLGYIAHSQILRFDDVYGVVIFVQGSQYDPIQMDSLIEDSLEVFEKMLQDSISQSEIDKVIQSFISEEFERLEEKGGYFEKAFLEDPRNPDFFRREQIKKSLAQNQFTAQDLQSFFVQHFKNTNSRLSLQLFNSANQNQLPKFHTRSQEYSGQSLKYITSIEQLQKFQQNYYQLHNHKSN